MAAWLFHWMNSQTWLEQQFFRRCRFIAPWTLAVRAWRGWWKLSSPSTVSRTMILLFATYLQNSRKERQGLAFMVAHRGLLRYCHPERSEGSQWWAERCFAALSMTTLARLVYCRGESGGEWCGGACAALVSYLASTLATHDLYTPIFRKAHLYG
jgi:hypothetical protein